MLDRKNLIFDLGGVLLNIDPRATVEALATMGVGKSLITDGLNLTNPLLRGLECGTVTPEEICTAVAATMGVELSPALAQSIKEAWCSMLKDAPVEKFQRLRMLRKQGYKVFLLSNTNAIHWEIIERIISAVEGGIVNDYFEGVYLSFEMQCCKPDRMIFEKLLAKEGIVAEDCIFFDDSQENCAAAASLGISAHLMTRNAPWPQWLIE